MDYIRKSCPICGNEFFVLDNVKVNVVYCTLICLSESQEKMNENRFPSSLV